MRVVDSLTAYCATERRDGRHGGARGFPFIFRYSIPLQTRTVYRPTAVALSKVTTRHHYQHASKQNG